MLICAMERVRSEYAPAATMELLRPLTLAIVIELTSVSDVQSQIAPDSSNNVDPVNTFN